MIFDVKLGNKWTTGFPSQKTAHTWRLKADYERRFGQPLDSDAKTLAEYVSRSGFPTPRYV